MPVKTSSIKKIFTQFIIFAISLPIFILGITEVLISTQIIRDELSKNEERYIRLMVDYIDHNLKQPLDEVNLLTAGLESGASYSDIDIELLADVITSIYPHVRSIEITNDEGVIVKTFSDNEGNLGYDISGYDYFRRAKKSNDIHWSASYFSSDYKEALVSLVKPYEGGYILLHLSLNNLKDFTSDTLYEDTGLLYSITDQYAVYVSHMDLDKVKLRENDPDFNRLRDMWNGDVIQSEVEYFGEIYYTYNHFISDVGWMVTLYKSKSEVLRPVYIMVGLLLIITFALLTIGVMIGQRISKKISLPIKELVGASRLVAKGEYNVTMAHTEVDELKQLNETFLEMSGNIKNSHTVLENELQASREQLILSEKMAALGELVAGVTHEINTPIGIIVTSSSFMETAVKELMNYYTEGKLSKTKFDEFCDNAQESTKIILNNSKRAADLIKSFKSVAVDQTSMHIREFKLKNYTEEVLESLHHYTKKRDIKISVNCSREISVKSYPGSYSQIINNLIMNSFIHGFPEDRTGEINIDITEVDAQIILVYRDTGVGIQPDVLQKIFDPFFTTKRNDGGSGLGMNIVYTVITENLRGEINCSSKVGEWTEFRITFPSKLELVEF